MPPGPAFFFSSLSLRVPIALVRQSSAAAMSAFTAAASPYNVAGQTLSFTLSEKASVTIQLVSSGGTVDYTTTYAGAAGSNSFTYVYPGVGNSNQRLAAGTYSFVLTGTPSGGSSVTANATLTVTR